MAPQANNVYGEVFFFLVNNHDEARNRRKSLVFFLFLLSLAQRGILTAFTNCF